MTVPNRLLNRATGVAFAIFSVSCQIAVMEGAPLVATEGVPFPERIVDHNTLRFTSQADVNSSGTISLHSVISGAIFAQDLPRAYDTETISGWFHIIWNETPRFRLVDDEGEWVDLLIDEQVLRDAGGPLGLNRKRVRVTGRRSEKTPEVIQVITIQPEDKRNER